MTIHVYNTNVELSTPDDVRINSMAVRFVEVARTEQVGQTAIHVLGQGDVPIMVADPVDAVNQRVGGLIKATRHYLAGPPADGGSVVFIAPSNVACLRPNAPVAPAFWTVTFIDGSELRIVAPLPAGL